MQVAIRQDAIRQVVTPLRVVILAVLVTLMAVVTAQWTDLRSGGETGIIGRISGSTDLNPIEAAPFGGLFGGLGTPPDVINQTIGSAGVSLAESYSLGGLFGGLGTPPGVMDHAVGSTDVSVTESYSLGGLFGGSGTPSSVID